MLEALICMIIKVEKEILPQTETLIQICIDLSDFEACWSTRKNVVDLAYSMVAILEQDIGEFKQTIFEFVSKLRHDKQKPV